MITFHPIGGAAHDCSELGKCDLFTTTAVWIDLLEPTPEEENAVEAALGIDIPTREEMEEIETSSRLYKDKDLHFLTTTLIAKADTREPEKCAVTFILGRERLVTLRYVDLQPFRKFRSIRDAHSEDYDTPAKVLGGLLDAAVDRIADLLESAGRGVDRISRHTFRTSRERRKEEKALAVAERGFRGMLRALGYHSELVSLARESLVTLGRAIVYLSETADQTSAEFKAHLEAQRRDVVALSDHANFLASKISFLLDATLGLINVEQNVIIKVFTVAAVFFLPPTVVGTIYGMNFEWMPELTWRFGYPFALGLMLISAFLPYLYFKRRGWF